MFRNFSKDRKTNCFAGRHREGQKNKLYFLYVAGRERRTECRQVERFLYWISFFLFLVISLHSVLSFKAFISSTHPYGMPVYRNIHNCSLQLAIVGEGTFHMEESGHAKVNISFSFNVTYFERLETCALKTRFLSTEKIV